MGIPAVASTRLILAGDIETNPGPPKPTASLPTTTWTCHLCNKHITSRHFSYRCKTTPIHWVHKTCTSTLLPPYDQKHWTCSLHTQNTTTTQQQTNQNPPQPPAPSTSQHKTRTKQATLNPLQTQSSANNNPQNTTRTKQHTQRSTTNTNLCNQQSTTKEQTTQDTANQCKWHSKQNFRTTITSYPRKH